MKIKQNKINIIKKLPHFLSKVNKIRRGQAKNILIRNILYILGVTVILISGITFISTNYIFAKEKEEEKLDFITDFENNDNVLELSQILSDNMNIVQKKELVTEEREIKYTTEYRENNSLPKDEKVVIEKGIPGKQNVTLIRTFENEEVIDENILAIDIIKDYKKEIVEVGTSEFLAKYKIHIGDLMYTTKNVTLKEKASDDSKSLGKIRKSIDVKLIELNGDWCKVTIAGYEGYLKSDSLTSAYVTPDVVKECRIQKAKVRFKFDMKLNEPSGLELEDFKKIFSNNAKDKNKIFENNAEAFYNAEQKYSINGIFLAAIAIHESGWGTSIIAKDKNNLFGYKAYDSDPYNSSAEFITYEDGINTVAKALSKNYINMAGTKMYGDELTVGKYYNGSTIAGVNTRYASDKGWALKVYNIMKSLYEKL